MCGVVLSHLDGFVHAIGSAVEHSDGFILAGGDDVMLVHCHPKHGLSVVDLLRDDVTRAWVYVVNLRKGNSQSEQPAPDMRMRSVKKWSAPSGQQKC